MCSMRLMNSGVTSGIHQLFICQGLSLFLLAGAAPFLLRRESQWHLSTFPAPTVLRSNALVQPVARYMLMRSNELPALLLFLCLCAHVVYLPKPLASLLLQIVSGSAVWFARSHRAVD